MRRFFSNMTKTIINHQKEVEISMQKQAEIDRQNYKKNKQAPQKEKKYNDDDEPGLITESITYGIIGIANYYKKNNGNGGSECSGGDSGDD